MTCPHPMDDTTGFAEQGPRLLLVPRIDDRAPRFDGVVGSTADILAIMFGPPQHDNHIGRWRWHLKSLEADKRAAAVAALADKICAKELSHD